MQSITTYINRFNYYILNPLIVLMFALAFVYFVYGIVRFLSIDANEKGNSREEARNSIMWGLIGMAIMLSVYGLIAFVLTAFGIRGSDVGGASNYIRFY